MTPISAEALALQRAAEGGAAWLRRKIRRILGLNRAYLRLFFDQQGELKPEARDVLLDLLDAAEFSMGTRETDLGALARREGQRALVLHLFGRFRLPEQKLAELERQLKQARESEP